MAATNFTDELELLDGGAKGERRGGHRRLTDLKAGQGFWVSQQLFMCDRGRQHLLGLCHASTCVSTRAEAVVRGSGHRRQAGTLLPVMSCTPTETSSSSPSFSEFRKAT